MNRRETLLANSRDQHESLGLGPGPRFKISTRPLGHPMHSGRQTVAGTDDEQWTTRELLSEELRLIREGERAGVTFDDAERRRFAWVRSKLSTSE